MRYFSTSRRFQRALRMKTELTKGKTSYGHLHGGITANREVCRVGHRMRPAKTKLSWPLAVLSLLLLALPLRSSESADAISQVRNIRAGGSNSDRRTANRQARNRGWGPEGGAPGYAKRPPRDSILYEELEVHWGASAREIKKAYYRLAVRHHPDKQPGDAQAEHRFKRVSEAYQILQDDAVREQYHRKGLASLEEDGHSWSESDGRGGQRPSSGRRQGDIVDPMKVFQTFLGGGEFEHLIGPLSARMVPVDDPDYHYQKARALAEDLECRLEVYVQGDKSWFDRTAWVEALQLRGQSMGRQILKTVGYVYTNYAQRSLGKLATNILQPQAIRGKMRYVSDRAHQMNNLLAAISSTTKLYVHLQTRRPSNERVDRGENLGAAAAEDVNLGEEETVAKVLDVRRGRLC